MQTFSEREIALVLAKIKKVAEDNVVEYDYSTEMRNAVVTSTVDNIIEMLGLDSFIYDEEKSALDIGINTKNVTLSHNDEVIITGQTINNTVIINNANNDTNNAYNIGRYIKDKLSELSIESSNQ